MANSNLGSAKPQAGFTLIELVMVIILLGVLANATTQFLVIGINTYNDAAGRLALIDNARFAIERLNRELRNALPNSIRTTNAGTCIEFVPIKTSGTYIYLPIAPTLAQNTGTLVSPKNYTWQNGDELAVYITSPQEVYAVSQKIFPILSISDLGGDTTEVDFTHPVQFSEQSPTFRYYITQQAISWCVETDKLVRRQPSTGQGVLMAESIEQNGLLPFSVAPANLSRNSLSTVELRFINSDEQVIFYNEIQTPNQP